MSSRLCLLLLTFPLLFFSCRRGTVPVASPPAEPEKVNKVTVHNINYTNFTSRGRMQMDASGSRQSSSVNIRMKKDSVVWVSVVPALGIEAFRAKITPDSFMVVDRINKHYYAGRFDLLKTRYNVDLSFEMLQNIIIGNYTPGPPGQEQLLYDTPNQHSRQRRNGLTIDQYVDTTNYKLVRVEALDTNSSNQISADYTDFIQVEAWPFPSSILIGIKGQQNGSTTTFSLSHRQVSVSETDLTFPFSVPAGYEAR